jgi:hypothetical protein
MKRFFASLELVLKSVHGGSGQRQVTLVRSLRRFSHDTDARASVRDCGGDVGLCTRQVHVRPKKSEYLAGPHAGTGQNDGEIRDLRVTFLLPI